ncbi:MAG: hypothetical protein EBX27_03825, partial [Proteobacteria bacterium]|nr:hypothetical protein [Pseudomonadota bacterium]
LKFKTNINVFFTFIYFETKKIYLPIKYIIKILKVLWKLGMKNFIIKQKGRIKKIPVTGGL